MECEHGYFSVLLGGAARTELLGLWLRTLGREGAHRPDTGALWMMWLDDLSCTEKPQGLSQLHKALLK